MDLALAKSPSLDSRVLPTVLDRPYPLPHLPTVWGLARHCGLECRGRRGGVWRPEAQGIRNILRLTSQGGGPVCGKGLEAGTPKPRLMSACETIRWPL